MDYYESGIPDDLTFTTADDAKVDNARQDRISVMAQSDVSGRKKKRTQADFNNPSEYKLYQLCVYDAALRAYKGID